MPSLACTVWLLALLNVRYTAFGPFEPAIVCAVNGWSKVMSKCTV